MKKMWLVALFALQACSEVGLFPTSGSNGGDTVAIPRLILNCQTAHCRTNSSPLINVLITTSSCADPLFGATVSSSTRSISCDGTIGCYGEVNGWVASGGASTTSIAAGIYNICACVDYTGTGTPWVNCNTLGSLNNVTFSVSSGMRTITTWIDQ